MQYIFCWRDIRAETLSPDEVDAFFKNKLPFYVQGSAISPSRLFEYGQYPYGCLFSATQKSFIFPASF